MASRMSRVVQRLKQQEAVRFQVLAYLLIVRIHNLVKSSYEDRLASSKFYSFKPANCRPPDRDDEIDPSYWRARSSSSCSHKLEHVERAQAQEGEATTAFTAAAKRRASWAPTAEARGREGGLLDKPARACGRDGATSQRHDEWWDWQGFPELWHPFQLYDFVSNIWIVWATIRTLFLRQLEGLISPATQYFFGMPGNCFLPGRLAIPLALSPLFTILFTFYHMAWRIGQRFTKHDRLISMVVFLMASERDLEQFGAALEANDGSLQSCMPGSGLTESATGRGGSSKQPQQPVATQSNKHLFFDALCYQVYGRNSAYYFKLRVNRTPEARARLVHHMVLTNITAIITFCVCFVPLLVSIVITICSDYRYAHVYRNCYPPLERLRALGQLDYFTWSGVWNWHHVLSALIFDLLENTFIWVDSGLILIFVPVFSYLLNYDLRLYWAGLEVKLERLLERAKYQYLMREEHKQQQVASFYNFASLRMHALDEENIDLVEGHHNSPTYLERSQTSAGSRWLETDIHEIQFEVCDFFNQMKRADGLVGDTLTTCILIWLTSLAFVCCNRLLYSNDPLASVIGFALGLGFCVITVATFFLFELRRCCLKSYHVLCSLMAYDQSSCKLAFLKLLDYYTSSRTNYHLLRAYPYKPTTFITILGWSFSYFFIACSLFGPQSKTGSVSANIRETASASAILRTLL